MQSELYTKEQEKNGVVRVPKRILSSLLASVSAGVVPRAGAPYIAIGRRDEIAALLSDLETVSDGGGSMRFLIGRYGSGKSFLLQLVRGYALEKGFVTADADLTPERRLYGAGGSGVATYRELIKNLATKASPDGGALPKIIVRWITGLQTALVSEGILPDAPDFSERLSARVFRELQEIEMMVGGFDFARVVTGYYRAYLDGNEEGKSAAIRYLRGEFSTKTEARSALGFTVSTIISDENWYDFLKLWAALLRTPAMGYRGLVVFIDECVNLYKINHRISRENNYEKILSMFNDTLQGRAPGLALVLGGTPQFLEDTRRGLFSYEALRSRLCDSRFALEGFKNLIGPVIRLRRLSDDELFALIKRITMLYAENYNWEPRISEAEMVAFLNLCLSRAGANSMITPREMLRDYMTVLNILMQNPEANFYDIVGTAVTLRTPEESEEEMGIADHITEENNTAHREAGKGEMSEEHRRYTPDDIEF